MTVRNGQRYLAQAIGSILSQTLVNFEFLVVDDASDDDTPGIIGEYAARDPRVRVLRNDRNLGPYPSANLALAQARAALIARMDADDICEPERLAMQFGFLRRRPEYVLVATGYRAIDAGGRVLYTKKKPADHEHLRFLLRFRMPLEHPSMMFRASLPDGSPVRYPTTTPVAQDYALVARLALKGKAAVLPGVLFNYRVHEGNITARHRQEQASVKYAVARAVQSNDWPAERVAALDGLMRCYLLHERASLGALRSALSAFRQIRQEMIGQGLVSRRWLDRQIAEILGHAFLRNGSGSADPLFCTGFALCAIHHLPHLVTRYAENRDWLPRRLVSHPDVEG